MISHQLWKKNWGKNREEKLIFFSQNFGSRENLIQSRREREIFFKILNFKRKTIICSSKSWQSRIWNPEIPKNWQFLNFHDSGSWILRIWNPAGKSNVSQFCLPTPGFLWDLGERQVKFRSKKAIFRAIFFYGFGPCLGIRHTHLGEISKKNVFFGRLPLC